MEEIRFEVRHPDGRTERLVVPSAKATIGAGAHCDLRLAVDQATAEHVVVELVPDGLQLKSLASTPPTSIDSVPLTTRTVPQWALLHIANTQIYVARAAQKSEPTKKKLNSTLILRLGGVLAAVPLLFMAMNERASREQHRVPRDTPELFDEATASCPRSDPAEARVVAEDAHALADAARQRSPFAVTEAIVAVKSYGIAATCYRHVHEEHLAAEADDAAQQLREATMLDFRARKVRLERALAVNDVELAIQDVAVLTSLTEGKKGPYVAWLLDTEQQLKRKGEGVRR